MERFQTSDCDFCKNKTMSQEGCSHCGAPPTGRDYSRITAADISNMTMDEYRVFRSKYLRSLGPLPYDNEVFFR